MRVCIDTLLYLTVCSPILTHNNRGVAKPGVRKSDFAIIYTGPSPPQIRADEHPRAGEAPMRPWPIRVDPDDRGTKLTETSRVNFGKVYTIEHNVKVKSFGNVNRDNLYNLKYQFAAVWNPAFSQAPAMSIPFTPSNPPAAATSSSAQNLPGSPRAPPNQEYTREQLRARAQTQPLPVSVQSAGRSQSHSTRSDRSHHSQRSYERTSAARPQGTRDARRHGGVLREEREKSDEDDDDDEDDDEDADDSD